jgi:hypothetical protein
LSRMTTSSKAFKQNNIWISDSPFTTDSPNDTA